MSMHCSSCPVSELLTTSFFQLRIPVARPACPACMCVHNSLLQLGPQQTFCIYSVKHELICFKIAPGYQEQFSDPEVSNMVYVMQYSRHAYETHAYLPTYFAVTLSMYTLIPTVYRALLKSAVSGTDHRIHTTNLCGKATMATSNYNCSANHWQGHERPVMFRCLIGPQHHNATTARQRSCA